MCACVQACYIHLQLRPHGGSLNKAGPFCFSLLHDTGAEKLEGVGVEGGGITLPGLTIIIDIQFRNSDDFIFTVYELFLVDELFIDVGLFVTFSGPVSTLEGLLVGVQGGRGGY